MRKIVTVIAYLIFTTALAYAETPEEISKAYFALLKAEKWEEIAQLHDASALHDFREMMSFIFEMQDDLATQFLGKFFGQGANKATVKAMSDTMFFSSFMKGAMAQAASLGQLDFKQVDVLGSIQEEESLRHVVTRAHIAIGEITVENMEVTSFRKTGGEWKILMKGKMKGMAQQFKKAFSQ